MREIKFRGIDTESGKWIYGGYVLLKSGVNCILSGEVSHMTLPDSHPRAPTYEELNVLQFHAVKYKTVGEYTGLKDRNGKEIYEGDIVRLETDEGEDWAKVEWCEAFDNEAEVAVGCSFQIFYRDTGDEELECDGEWIEGPREDIEIIGNLQENPELLEGP